VDYKKMLARITEKWPAKVISLVVAIILFAFHRMGDMQERFFSVPLQLNTDNNLVPSRPYPRNIRVILRGDTNTIYYIAENDIEAFLDLTRYSEPGVYNVPVQINKKGTAFETESPEITVDPAEITMELDTRMSKQLPVSPRFQGYIESGYEMISHTLTPNQMIVDGPTKLMGSITELSTELIDLRSRNSDFSVRVQIVNPNPLLSLRGVSSAEFTGFIRELIMVKQFEELPIRIRGLSGELQASIEPVSASIRIHGIQKQMDLLDDQQLLEADCSALTEPGVYQVPLSVSVPPELVVDRKDPEHITVTVALKEQE